MRRTLSIIAVSLVLVACTTDAPSPSTGAPSSSTSSSLSSMTSSQSSSVISKGWTWDGNLLIGSHTVTLKTSKGDITLELDASAAPKTVTNFIALASTGYYDGLTFHRVIPGFMIQGGDPTGNGTGGKSVYGETFDDEIDPDSSLYQRGYKKGVIAMANRGPHTNGSQFFIMDADYPLPPNYTIFGHVTQGQNVVQAIANVPRGKRQQDMPNEPVTFNVELVK